MKYLFNLALLFIAISAAAQSNYQSGYIVKNNNDTLRGFINSKDVQITPKYVEFKSSKDDGSITKYTPTDIKGYYIAPYYTYISYTGKLSNNKNLYPNIDETKDTTTSYGSIFLQKIVSGPNAALYVNSDDQKARYFLKVKDSAPVELIYYEYGARGEQTRKESPFLAQLIEAFSKYNGMNNNRIDDLQKTEFTRASLEDAVTMINKDIKDKSVTPNYIRFFVGASASSVKSTVSGLFSGMTSSESATNMVPKFSLGIDLISNPDVQKLLFRGELSFSDIKPHYTFSYTPNGVNVIDNNTYNFEQYTISLEPQIIYNFYSSVGFKFFAGAGASINYSITKNNVINYSSIVSFSPYTLKSYTEAGPNSAVLVNFPVKAGIVLNKCIELSLIYSPPVNVVGWSLTYQSIGGGINYLF